MIHTNKKQGHSSAEDGCPVGYPKKCNLYLFAWEAKRAGGMREGYPLRALCGSRAAPAISRRGFGAGPGPPP